MQWNIYIITLQSVLVQKPSNPPFCFLCVVSIFLHIISHVLCHIWCFTSYVTEHIYMMIYMCYVFKVYMMFYIISHVLCHICLYVMLHICMGRWSLWNWRTTHLQRMVLLIFQISTRVAQIDNSAFQCKEAFVSSRYNQYWCRNPATHPFVFFA